MLSWDYEAIDSEGARVKGRVRADTEQDALSQIIAKQLSPLSVKRPKNGKSLFNRISAAEIEQLTTELGLLLRNGVQLDRALEMMSQASANVLASDMLAGMTEDVRAGNSLYSTFARYPAYFDQLFCEMIKIGEESGKLAATLERLGHNLKFQNELKSKVSQAMVYPAFILAVCIVSLFAIFNFIVPSMEGLFANMQDIPAYTAFLINTSGFVRENQILIILATLGFIAFVMLNWQKPWLQNGLNSVLKRTPVMKTGLMLNERIKFISAMQLMLQSGLPLAQALSFVVNVARDKHMKKQLERTRDEVSQGKMLSESLSATDILEPVMLSLVRVGEESGRLDSVFTEMNDRARWRFEQWAIKLTSMLEPLLIIVMGGLVGSVVVTMLLSIVSTSDVPF